MKKLFLIWYEKEILNEIGILKFENGIYTFEYTNYDLNDLQLFSKNGLFPGFLDLNKKYKEETLFLNIKGRLPSSNRLDYKELLDKYDVKDKNDDFEILEKTKGRVSTDNFIFVTEKELKELKETK